jgi:hypothetical protein
VPEALAASCGNHASAPAVATCRRCGLFLCDACVVIEDDQGYCASCVALRQAAPSLMARASVVLPLSALACAVAAFIGTELAAIAGLLGGPLWVGGVAAVVVERRRLREHPDAVRSRLWLRAGAWFSVLGFLGFVPTALMLLWLFTSGSGHRH